jgi:hypothetical protein
LSAPTGINTSSTPTSTLNYSPVLKLTLTWTDPEGKRGETHAWLAYTTTIGASSITVNSITTMVSSLAPLFQNCSSCQLYSITWSETIWVGLLKPTEQTGQPINIEDKVFVELVGTLGQIVKFEIPAPLPTCFESDLETVTVGTGPILSLVTSLINGETTGQSSQAATTASLAATDRFNTATGLNYMKGYYTRKKNRRKLRAGISTETGG